MPVAALVEAGDLFGIDENAVRVAVARLRASGYVERNDRGQYRLGPAAQAVNERVRSWRDLEARTGSWNRGWIGVLSGPMTGQAPRSERQERVRALGFLGFRSLARSLTVRPDNLRGGVRAVRDELTTLGLPAGDMIFELGGLDAVTEARARALWDVATLRRSYRKLLGEIERGMQRLPGLGPERAMVETFLIGGRAVRELTYDPLLPDALGPTTERCALIDALTRYDRHGRAAWAAFLERFGTPHYTPARAPMNASA